MYVLDLLIRVGIPIICGVIAGVLYGRWKNDIEKLICEVADEHNARLDAENRLRWIPVAEQLPEENAPCIVYNKDYGPMVGWRVDGKRFRIPGSRFPDHPTHWMPLPEPPKEVLSGTDMRGGIRRDDAGNVIDWGITGPPGEAGKAEVGE